MFGNIQPYPVQGANQVCATYCIVCMEGNFACSDAQIAKNAYMPACTCPCVSVRTTTRLLSFVSSVAWVLCIADMGLGATSIASMGACLMSTCSTNNCNTFQPNYCADAATACALRLKPTPRWDAAPTGVPMFCSVMSRMVSIVLMQPRMGG